MTDPRGKVSTAVYDDYGNVVSVTDPLDNQSTAGFDLTGRPLWSVSPEGNKTGGDPDAHRSAVLGDAGGLALMSLGAGSHPVIDGFDRADGSLGAAATGQAWTAQAGTFAVDGQRVKLASASGTTNQVTVDVGSGDMEIGFTVTAAQKDLGVVLRRSDATHYWRVAQNPTSGKWELRLRNGGSDAGTLIVSSAAGTCCTAGQRVVVRAVSSKIQVYLDGVLALSTTSSANIGASLAGVYAAATGAGRMDDFAVGRATGGVDATVFDPDGNPVRSMSPNGNVTATAFDADGRPVTVIRPDSSTVGYGWDGNGRQTSYIDGASNATTYAYDHQGRPAVEDRAGMAATNYAYAYGTGGETRTVTQPGGGTVTTIMDALGRPSTVDYSSSTPDVSLAYDHAGNRVGMTTGTGAASTWAFDSLGRLTGSSRAGRSVGYGYDIAGNRTQVTYPGSNTVDETYDDAGRFTAVDDWVNPAITFAYDADSNLTSTVFPNGVTSHRTYDEAGRPTVTSIDTAVATLASFTQSYDSQSQVTSTTTIGGPSAGTTNYAYNQLSKVTAPINTYDAADNLTKTYNASRTTTYQGFNSAGQLCWTAPTTATGCTNAPTGATLYSYDNRGNRTIKTPATGSATSYSWDQGNRLTAITGAQTGSYTYDGDGLRLSKTIGAASTTFTWDDSGGLPTLLEDGGDRYIYGPQGEPLERITSTGATTYIHQDHLGSTRTLTGTTGTVTGTYTFDPYGTTRTHTGTTINLQYAGQYTDPETGNQYLRNRYYDPTTGQFLTLDPAVTTTQEPYGYTNGNPINGTDPSGLCGLLGDGPCTPSGIADDINERANQVREKTGVCNKRFDEDCESVAEKHQKATAGARDAAGGALVFNPFTTRMAGRVNAAAGVNRASLPYIAGGAAMALVDIAALCAAGQGGGVVSQWGTGNSPWVMNGPMTPWNFLTAGLPGGIGAYSTGAEIAVEEAGPLVWPSGWQWIKGILGQRIMGG